MLDRCITTAASRRGFTLFDLLVLVALFALGTALLAPIGRRLAADALLASCLDNQRQMGIGWGSYAAEYNAIAANENDGCTYSYPAGAPGTAQYGSFAAWLPAQEMPAKGSRPVGIGLFYPYIASSGAYYCPGTSVSPRWQEIYWRGQEWTPEEKATIVVNPDLKGGWGQPARAVFTTYSYRGGIYRDQKMPTSSADFVECVWTPKRPDSVAVQGKPFLTCCWATGFYEHPLKTRINHGGARVNLANADGSASSWTLPGNMLPIWQWYETWDKTLYDGSGFDSNKFLKQLPWWWTLSDNRSADAPAQGN